jgi:signal peptidase I
MISVRSRLGATAIAVAMLGTLGCNRSLRNLGEAMAPTLKDNEFVSASRVFTSISRGDIVVFRYPRDETKSFVKRVIGSPGDQLASDDGRVSLNGKPLDEPYVIEANRSHDSWGPLAVPADQFFVMGDNRRNSSDSRHWGLVKRGAIWGKVDR